MISPELLRRYPFFGYLSEAHLKAIAMLADSITCAKDKTIFESGHPADALYFLVEGGVDLHYVVIDRDDPNIHKDFFISEINPGEPFGISALIEPYQFTGTVIASSPCRIIKIDAAGLRALCEVDPVITAILMRQTAKAAMSRLHDTRVQLAAARA